MNCKVKKGNFSIFYTGRCPSKFYSSATNGKQYLFIVNCVSNGDANESLNTLFSSVTSVSTANVGLKELCFKKNDVKQTTV